MSPRIWKGSEVSTEHLRFTKSKGKFISVECFNQERKKSEKFYLLTPKMEYYLPVRYERLRISLFLDKDRNTKFSGFFKELDEYIPKIAYKNRKEWFEGDEMITDMDFESFFENYYHQVQTDKDTKQDCLRFNLPLDLDRTLYNEENKLIESSIGLDPLQELAFSKYRVSILLRCRGIWINEEAYGLSWDAYQLKVFEVDKSLPQGCQFLPDLEAVRNHVPKPILIREIEPPKADIIPSPSNPNDIQSESQDNNSEKDSDIESAKPKIVNYLMMDD